MTKTLRIVSLVPSLTATVCEIGLRDQLVGCTKFCVLPKGLHKTCAMVGGTKDPDLEIVARLRPTHVIVNEEENTPSHIQRCHEIADVIETFPKSPADVPEMMRSLGERLDAPSALSIANDIELTLGSFRGVAKDHTTFIYLIWRDPYMAVGPDTYASRFLELVGWRNCVPENVSRYPVVTPIEMMAWNPGLVLLGSEPFPFRKRQMEELADSLNGIKPTFWKVDGQATQWYGSSTLAALRELSETRRTGWLSSSLFKIF